MKKSFSLLLFILILFSSTLLSQTSWYVRFQHNFNVTDDYIGVGKWGEDPFSYSSPHNDYVQNGEVVNLEAYDNQWVDNNAFKISFNDSEAPANKSDWHSLDIYVSGIHWSSNEQSPSFTASSTIFPGQNPVVQANMKRWIRRKFSNQFSGSSMGGQMVVNSQTYTAPTANFEVIDQNTISYNALQSYTNNNIQYNFQKWNDNVTSFVRTETLDFYDDNSERIAIYKGYPIFNEYTAQGNLRNLTFSTSSPQGYVVLTWNEHPNEYVTKYYIYRRYKYNGVYSPIALIATRNKGAGSTQSYTDVEFEVNQQDGDYQVEYDVKAYFSLDGTKSSNNFKTVIADRSGQLSKIGSGEGITYYDISNYPNPYNPETTIRFQLPQEGFVTIKVYNSLGEEIKTLLNEKKDYGKYELKFNGGDLPSGMYIYTIKVNDYFASKKMLLIK